MDFDLLKVLDKITKNYIVFTDSFQTIFQKVKKIIELELILTTLSLYHYEPDNKYVKQLLKHKAIEILAERTVKIPDDFHFQSTDEFLKIAKRIFIGIENMVSSLPPEETLLASRLKNEEYERAKNIATYYINNQELSEATFLYIDFTGLRTIPEPKEAIISQYYKIVKQSAQNTNGIRLYGGKDGDDAFSFLFNDIEQAIQCAKLIKMEFVNNLFLSSTGDIKFGICAKKFSDDKNENEILQCWGLAKDCCEYKRPSFSKKGNLLVSQETIDYLINSNSQIVECFKKIENDALLNVNNSLIYKFLGIEPIK